MVDHLHRLTNLAKVLENLNFGQFSIFCKRVWIVACSCGLHRQGLFGLLPRIPQVIAAGWVQLNRTWRPVIPRLRNTSSILHQSPCPPLRTVVVVVRVRRWHRKNCSHPLSSQKVLLLSSVRLVSPLRSGISRLRLPIPFSFAIMWCLNCKWGFMDFVNSWLH